MLDGRLRAQVEQPTGLLQAPGEVGVLCGAQTLIEPSDLLERLAADEEVRRNRARTVGMSKVLPLAEESAGGAVPRRQRRPVHGR